MKNEKNIRELATYFNTYRAQNLPKTIKTDVSPEEYFATCTEEEKAVLELAAETWKNFIKTEEGIAFQKSLKTEGHLKASEKLIKLLRSPIFRKVRKAFKALKALEVLPSSLSIAYTEGAGLVVGGNFSIGGAIGFSGKKLNPMETASFVSFGGSVGPEVGAMAGVQFGLWRAAPANLGGISGTAAVSAGDDVGVGFGVSFVPKTLGLLNPFIDAWRLLKLLWNPVKDIKRIEYAIHNPKKAFFDVENDLASHVLGFSLTVGVGFELAAEVGAGFTIVTTNNQNDGKGAYLQPSVQPAISKKNFLIIENLKCIVKKESTDEIYFTFQADTDYVYFYPTYDHMKMDNTYNVWNCGRSVWFNDSVLVNVYNDGIGTHGHADRMFVQEIMLGDLTTENPKTYTMTVYKDNNPSKKVEYQYTMDVRLVAQNVDHSIKGHEVPSEAEVVLS